MIRALVAAGANMEARNKVCRCVCDRVVYFHWRTLSCSRKQIGWAPLRKAASGNHAAAVAALLDCGAGIEVRAHVRFKLVQNQLFCGTL